MIGRAGQQNFKKEKWEPVVKKHMKSARWKVSKKDACRFRRRKKSPKTSRRNSQVSWKASES